MADIGQAYVQIVPKAQGITAKLNNMFAGPSESAGTKAGDSAGSNMVKSIKGMIAKAAIGATIVKGVSAALNQGAELEQNLGGTEAVFGKFANSVQKTATKAYANMGLSASDYMATANKMGSLFQGSGLEQQKALELTQGAMQRAADVASVMGLDMGMAMESIAGAAKGNFTMMDNLGVAMNATTLEAYALEKGMNFKWNTASNAQKAELAMQMFFDRTSQYAGNFKRESAETFAGSFEAMKAAASNVLGNLALGKDIEPSMKALVKSVGTFVFGNLVPALGRIGTALPSAIGTAITAAAPTLMKKGGALVTTIGDMITTKGPELLTKGAELVQNLAAGFTANLPTWLDAGINAVSGFMASLANGIITGLPLLADKGVAIVTSIGNFITANLPTLQAKGAELLQRLGQGIATYLPKLGAVALQLIARFGNFIVTYAPVLLQKGQELVLGIVNGITAAIPVLASKAIEMVGKISEVIAQYLPTIGEKGGELLRQFASRIIANIPQVVAALGRLMVQLALAAAKALPAIVKALAKLAPAALKAGVSMIKGLVNGIKSGLGSVKAAAGNLVTGIVNKLKPVRDKVKSIMDRVKSAMSSAWDSIKSKASSAWNAIKDKMTKPLQTARDTMQGIIDRVRGMFPLNLGHIFNLQLPHFSVSGGTAPWGVGGKGTPPSWSVSWYAKAVDTPYMFNKPTLFGAGEAGDEIMYGRANLLRDIAEATSGGGQTTNNFYITVDGAEAPEQYARRLARQLQLEMRTA